MKSCTRRYLLLGLVLVSVQGAVLSADANASINGEKVDVEVIIAGMQANDALLTSCSGTFTIVDRCFSGNCLESLPPVPSGTSQGGSSVPVPRGGPLCLQTEIFAVIASFPNIRVSHEVREGSGVGGQLAGTEGEEIWDGNRLYRLSARGEGRKGVFITTKEYGPGMGMVPFYLALFPWHDPRVESFKKNKVVSLGTEEIDGTTTWVIEWTPVEAEFSDFHVRYWLDPARGCLPLKSEEYTDAQGESPICRTTYSDLKSYGGLWIPLSGKRDVFDSAGKVGASSEISTIRLTVNEPVPPDTFNVALPPGTAIWDDDLGMGRRQL